MARPTNKTTKTGRQTNKTTKTGRPTKLTPKLVDDLVEAIRLSGSYKTACLYAGVHYNTFNEWMKRGGREKHGEFLEFYESIRRALADAELERYSILRAASKTDWRAADAALGRVQRARERIEEAEEFSEGDDAKSFALPADILAPEFFELYRNIINGANNEYALEGGRGSTKSSVVALAIIYLLLNNPTMHALAVRQIYSTVKDSVYARIDWAIRVLGLEDKFKFTTSPFEIQYLPTGQKIYFRGADDAAKLKSITPAFGYIGALWFEEFDQFRGEAQVRNIVQSVLRGGDKAYRFETWNTPRTANHWVHKYIAVPKEKRYHNKSTYLTVPREWLGQIFFNEAEHLKAVNFPAYEHEYLGVANGVGGTVFENVEIREITDAEINQFDRIYHGLDFGYYPDPAHYSRSYFDAARLTLYIFGEVRAHKKRNEDFYKLMLAGGYDPSALLIADSAEPKSVMDYRAYGANVRGAQKGADSVRYRIRWMQGLTKIVIDPKRCPYSAQEFMDYEYEKTKDGEVLSEYPDENNHAIDSVGYGTNVLWMQKGK